MKLNCDLLNRRNLWRWTLLTPRKTLGGLVLFVIAVTVTMLCIGPVRAAVEIAYYTATSTERSVLLEWGTVREFNLDGFKILCKDAAEPESEYHVIGSRIAQGGTESGANYSFEVTSGIVYGESYCFRLEEVTTDDTSGEQFDLCGYGPGVTPTPRSALVTPAEGGLTPTAIILSPGNGSPAPTLETITPTATVTGETPTPTAIAPGDVGSPLDTPTPTAIPPFTPTATPTSVSLSPLEAGSSSPLPTPISGNPSADSVALASPPLPPVSTPLPPATATMMSAAQPTLVEAATDTPVATATEPPKVALEPNPDSSVPGESAGTGAIVAPTPLYVVVTATPTVEAAAVALAPTFTPLPLATPVPVSSLYDFLAPSTQNLMVMLLCLIFLTASGLGTLGLVTTIVYMRSQNQRDQYPTRYFGRRR